MDGFLMYAYGNKLSPSVGNGLGGLPRRASEASDVRGEITFAVPGIYTWTPPKGVTSVSVVCVGGAGTYGNYGGGGGGLGWKNNIPVEFGKVYTVVVGKGSTYYENGGASYFISEATVCGYGGNGVSNDNGGTFVGDGGGNGGNGLSQGGGAGGYSGNGGNGNSAAPSGGGGGGCGTSVSAGGVGLFGQGTSGTVGVGGSGGQNGIPSYAGNYGSHGGTFGGAGKYGYGNTSGAHGGLRIIWGKGRAFPSTDCGQS